MDGNREAACVDICIIALRLLPCDLHSVFDTISICRWSICSRSIVRNSVQLNQGTVIPGKFHTQFNFPFPPHPMNKYT